MDDARSARSPPAGDVDDIDGAIARMQSIAAALPPSDGVACFNRLYLAVTEAVRDALAAHRFADPLFIPRLDPAFANLYFNAYFNAPDGAPPCAWQPLLDARGRSDVLPLQFALAGMNAHIDRDLMIAVADACVELGIAPDRDSPQYRDYLLINELLATELQALEAGYVPPAVSAGDRALGGPGDLAALWSLEAARDVAWSRAESLFALSGHPLLRKTYIDGVDVVVGATSLALLRPIPGLK
jgi:hypothetical protein